MRPRGEWEETYDVDRHQLTDVGSRGELRFESLVTVGI